jgi:uncharacterized membrane protein
MSDTYNEVAADRSSETIVGVSFDDHFRAQEFLSATSRLASMKKLVLKDAVVIQGRPDGRTAVHETVDPQPARTALSGALWSGLIGLLVAGPIGWIAGAAVGAGAGAATAKAVDLGLPDEWVEWFRLATHPETTTVALLVSDLHVEALIEETRRFAGARLVYANLDDATLQRIHASLHH